MCNSVYLTTQRKHTPYNIVVIGTTAIVGLVDEPDLIHKMKYIMCICTISCLKWLPTPPVVIVVLSVCLTTQRKHTSYNIVVIGTTRQMAEDLLQCCIGNKIASSRVGEGRPGSSLALPVAVGISVFIAVLTTVIVIIFILLRYVYTVGVMIITNSFNIILPQTPA